MTSPLWLDVMKDHLLPTNQFYCSHQLLYTLNKSEGPPTWPSTCLAVTFLSPSFEEGRQAKWYFTLCVFLPHLPFPATPPTSLSVSLCMPLSAWFLLAAWVLVLLSLQSALYLLALVDVIVWHPSCVCARVCVCVSGEGNLQGHRRQNAESVSALSTKQLLSHSGLLK